MNARRTPTIAVLLDGQPHPLPEGTDLAELVARLGHSPQGVSSAVNGIFVPRGQRAACALQDGDAVLFFRPIVGG